MSEVCPSVGRVTRGVLNCTVGKWKRIGSATSNATNGIATYSTASSSSDVASGDVTATSSMIGGFHSGLFRNSQNASGPISIHRFLPRHRPSSRSWLSWGRSVSTIVTTPERAGIKDGLFRHRQQLEKIHFTRVVADRTCLRSTNLFTQSQLRNDWMPRGIGCNHWKEFSTSNPVPGARSDDVEEEGRREKPSGDGDGISIDRSGLFHAVEHSHGVSPEQATNKVEEGPMTRHIESLIRFRGGPITLAEYMEEVLTNPAAGYYMNRDVFGAAGDFVTSPDVSQMFGELVGIWAACLWQQMGCPKRVRLVELGPGRGTLMSDLLRGTMQFRPFASSLSVHLVECSPTLRDLQWKTLRCTPSSSTMAESSPPNRTAKASPQAVGDNKKEVVESERSAEDEVKYGGDSSARVQEPVDDQVVQAAVSAISDAPVCWHVALEDVPRGDPTIIIAHEFFDALPVHQFRMTKRGWCEKLVDIAEPPNAQTFRYVLSPQATSGVKLYLEKRQSWMTSEERERRKAIEVCPAGMRLAVDIAKRVGEDGGAGLIIDYGKDHAMEDSLQAIKKHQFVDVLHSPGMADLSAYVDFEALRHAVNSSDINAVALGPIDQAEFLRELGIEKRLESLLRHANERQAKALREGYHRLVGRSEPGLVEPDLAVSDASLVEPDLAVSDAKADTSSTRGEGEGEGEGKQHCNGMGTRYKAMAIVSQSLSGPPVCFHVNNALDSDDDGDDA